MSKEQSKELTVQEKAKNFSDEYQKLCEKHGFRINAIPQFQARDDGSWSVYVVASISELPKEQ